MGRSDQQRSRAEERSETFPSPRPQTDSRSSNQVRWGRRGTSEYDNQNYSISQEQQIVSDLRLALSLDKSKFATLTDIGTFRAIAVEDLARNRHRGDISEAQKQLRNLSQSGLVRLRTSFPDRVTYVALTRDGHRILSSAGSVQTHGQRFYHGFVKTREARHDAALYRLFQEESARIEAKGGRVKRVVLDFELKQSMNTRLAHLKNLSESEQRALKRELAQEHGLTVVKGKIPLPDLRVEYETPDRNMAKVDLELVTGHYHRANIVAKAKAGFSMYAFADGTPHFRPAMEDPEIMQEILSL